MKNSRMGGALLVFKFNDRMVSVQTQHTQPTIPSFRVDSVAHNNDGLLTFGCVPGMYIIRFPPSPAVNLGKIG